MPKQLLSLMVTEEVQFPPLCFASLVNSTSMQVADLIPMKRERDESEE